MERSQNPAKHTLEMIRAVKPSMRYNGGDFEKWQKDVRAKLIELLGIPEPAKDDKLLIEYEKECDTYSETRFTFQSEEGYFVPAHLLVPKEAKGKIPVVICLQGHSTGMHISLGRPKYPGDEQTMSGGDRDFAVGVLEKGFAALTIEQRGMGECGGTEHGPACQLHTMANILIGRTTIGERVLDVSRAIDVLEKHFDMIDKDNIICLGNSGGGTTTFYAACIEERIKTAIPSCAFASYDDSIAAMLHCTCNFIPNVRNYFDMGDLSGLIAPRNLIIVSGKDDPIFPIDSAKKCFEITKELYSHSDGKAVHVIGNEGHRFYKKAAWEAYDEITK